MSKADEQQRELEALQEAIYRDKVLRSRGLTPEERLAEAFDLTDEVFQRMHDGAMSQLGTGDEEEGWREVRRRLARLSQVDETGLYADQEPAAPPASA
jgi:hypothetical protein